MAYASTSPISYLGTMAVGAMEDNTGFAPATKEIVSLTKAEASGHIQLTATARQAANQPDSSAIDTLCNRDISGSGAFTGTVPSAYTSTVGTGMAMDRLNAHANLMFGTGPIQMAQTFFIAEGFTQTSERLAPTLNKLDEGVEFGKFPNLDGLVYPSNGVFPNYLGSGYADYQAVATNGISSLVKNPTKTNFELLASDLVNLGSAFSITDIANFANPGQAVIALNNANGLTATGLDVVLASVGIDPESIYNLGSETYNVIMQSVLDAVNVPELVTNAQNLLGSNLLDMESLGDYTNFDKIFINSKDVISFNTIEEFREKLQAIELGRIETVAQLASYINSIEPVNLPTIDNRKNFVKRDYVNSVIAKFLGGTGTYNSITLQDMIGILGGVGVSTPATNYRAAMKALYDAGELTTLQTHLTEFAAGLNGDYSTITVVIPEEIVISDPSGIIIPSTLTADAYASYQTAKIGQIEADCARLMSRRNVNSDIQTAIDSWRLISKKVFDEKDFQSRIDMNYSIRTDFSDNAVNFVQGLRGTINERGKGPIINGLVNQAVLDGDIGGEYMRAYVKELENKAVADNFDIRWRAEFDE